MRIQFGKLKRRNLVVGKNNKMRPTQSITKDKIFNVINIEEGDTFVDLFAGTGAVGFEAVSLGAGECIWSDISRESVVAIKENIETFELNQDKYKVFKSDFRMVLRKLPFKADYIFIDPPFIAAKYYEEAIELIEKYESLSPEGMIILEKPIKIELNIGKQFKIKVRKKIGDKEILFITNYD